MCASVNTKRYCAHEMLAKLKTTIVAQFSRLYEEYIIKRTPRQKRNVYNDREKKTYGKHRKTLKIHDG